MNHSCCPNAKAFKRDEVSAYIFVWADLFVFHANLPSVRQIWAVEIPLQDKDGHAVVIALRPISKDKEISYYLFISFRLCNQDEKFGYAMLHLSYRSDNEHSRLPSPTSMKTFHTRRGRLNLQIMGSRVHAWNAKKSDRSERRTLLEFCGIWENLHVVYFTG